MQERSEVGTMNKPVNPKIMDAKTRFQSGVLQYKQMGY